MDLLEIAMLSVAAAITTIAAAIAGRRQGAPGFWAWSWSALIVAGLLMQVGTDWPLARAVGAVFAVLFPGLQLAGAIEHTGRPVPRWLVPALAGVSALRLCILLVGFESYSHMAVLAFELVALGGAAVLIFRAAGAQGRATLDWLLIAGFSLIGIAEIADSILDITGPAGLAWTGWLCVGIPVGVCQVLATFDRMRQRLAESLAERENALKALRESNDVLNAIAKHAQDVILEADSQRRIQYANPRFHELLGYTPDEVLGRDLRDFAWDTSEFPSREDFEGGRELVSGRHRVRHRDGTPLFMESSVRVYRRDGEPHIVVVARDVTERIRGEEQTQRAQKLESLGLLAGGIAHDFNNHLTGILGNADVALSTLESGDPAREPIAQVVEAAEGAAELTRQLQAYSGGSPFAIRPLDVNETLRSRAELLRAGVSDNVRFELELTDGLPLAEADPAYLIQAVLNLAINGAEACGGEPGTVRVTTGHVQMESRLPIPATGSLEPGPYVFIDVRDTGHGIDESAQDRIFDPFFTTKAIGRGLGLAMVHGVVQTLRGAILVDSKPEKGTCARLLLRVASSQTSAEKARTSVGASKSASILVVDDDPSVLRVVCAVLQSRGFEVLIAESGQHAEAIMAEQAEEIGLIVLDAVMPGESADLVLDRLRALRPDVPIMLMSGYTEAEATQRFSSSGELAGFLPKPFRAEELVAAVRNALAGER